MVAIEQAIGQKGMKGYLAGTHTGMNFRVFQATIADTEITAVTGKYKDATARAFTVTDFWASGKKFAAGEFFNFGEDFVITAVTVATGGGINVAHLASIVPTPAA